MFLGKNQRVLCIKRLLQKLTVKITDGKRNLHLADIAN